MQPAPQTPGRRTFHSATAMYQQSQSSYRKVSIPLESKAVDMSAVLLRDACQCPSCVHYSTNQRLFSVADIPSDISTKNVEVDTASRTVNITWNKDVPGFSEDHITKLPLDRVQGLSTSGKSPDQRAPQIPQKLWTSEPLRLPDYDYDTYMKDDSALYALIKQLRVDGLAFVTNIPGLETSLATIATRIGPIKDTFYGQTWDGKLSS